MDKTIVFGAEARDNMMKGIQLLYDAVSVTLGPMGKNVAIRRGYTTSHITKDGVTVAIEVSSPDDIQELGIQIVREAAVKTAEKAGDGTTTATVLAYNLVRNGMYHINAGANSVLIKKGIETAAAEATRYIKMISEIVEIDSDDIKNIASISANNDAEIGEMIAEIIKQIGKDASIVVDNADSMDTHVEIVKGLRFDSGYTSPHFITNPDKMSSVMENTAVLCCGKILNDMNELVNILEYAVKNNIALTIFADSIEGDLLSMLVLNKVKSGLKVVAVRVPGMGDARRELLHDIAIVTGATVISPEQGLDLDQFEPKFFGKAERIIVTKDNTTVIGGTGSQIDIDARLMQLRAQLDGTELNMHEKIGIKQRIAKLAGGVALIKVGGATEIEVKEKKDRIDDSIHAAKAAVEDGIVPGGGMSYKLASDAVLELMENTKETGSVKLGMKILADALTSPFSMIITNAGKHPQVIEADINTEIARATSQNETVSLFLGYDAKYDKVCNLKDAGVIDPAKVACVAIENAASVAGTLLTMECAISIVIPRK